MACSRANITITSACLCQPSSQSVRCSHMVVIRSLSQIIKFALAVFTSPTRHTHRYRYDYCCSSTVCQRRVSRRTKRKHCNKCKPTAWSELIRKCMVPATVFQFCSAPFVLSRQRPSAVKQGVKQTGLNQRLRLLAFGGIL